MRDVPVEIVAEYACEDADVTLQVADKIEPDLAERGVAEVCHDVECPLIPVLVDMEHEGNPVERRSVEQILGRA